MSGSVLPVQPFDGIVDLAEYSRYGPAAYVFTSNLRKAMRAIERLIDFGTPAELHP